MASKLKVRRASSSVTSQHLIICLVAARSRQQHDPQSREESPHSTNSAHSPRPSSRRRQTCSLLSYDRLGLKKSIRRCRSPTHDAGPSTLLRSLLLWNPSTSISNNPATGWSRATIWKNETEGGADYFGDRGRLVPILSLVPGPGRLGNNGRGLRRCQAYPKQQAPATLRVRQLCIGTQVPRSGFSYKKEKLACPTPRYSASMPTNVD